MYQINFVDQWQLQGVLFWSWFYNCVLIYLDLDWSSYRFFGLTETQQAGEEPSKESPEETDEERAMAAPAVGKGETAALTGSFSTNVLSNNLFITITKTVSLKTWNGS